MTSRLRIQALKEQISILGVLQALGISVQHNRFRCLNPERHSHGDKTPSVSVWPEKGIFKCWVCDEVRGDIFSLIQLSKGCSFPQAIEWLESQFPEIRNQSIRGEDSQRLSRRNKLTAKNPTKISEIKLPNDKVSETGLHFEDQKSSNKTISPGGIESSRDSSSSEDSSTEIKLANKNKLGDRKLEDTVSAIGNSKHDLDEKKSDDFNSELRTAILNRFLTLCAPIRPGPAQKYLISRRIFKKTWDAYRLRQVHDYNLISTRLLQEFSREQLQSVGLFNEKNHLRYFKHRLILPYFDLENQVHYFQARSWDTEVSPKELSLKGIIPFPYNLPALKEEIPYIYLCEGVIDTLTLLEQGFVAMGIPGAGSFKPEWAEYFKGRTVYISFDADAAGEAGYLKTKTILEAAGVQTRKMTPTKGNDMNDWFRGKK